MNYDDNIITLMQCGEGVIMNTPRHEQVEKAERLTVTVGKGQRRQLEVIAKKRRTSAATVVRWALDEYFERHPLNDGHHQGASRAMEDAIN